MGIPGLELVTQFEAPAGRCGAEAEGGKQGAAVALGEDGRGDRGPGIVPQERDPDAPAVVLVGQQSEQDPALGEGIPQGLGVTAAFEEQAAAASAKVEEETGRHLLTQRPVRGRTLNAGYGHPGPGKNLEVAEVTDGDDDAAVRMPGASLAESAEIAEIQMGLELIPAQGHRSDPAGVGFADSTEILPGDGADAVGGPFRSEAAGEIIEGDPAVT